MDADLTRALFHSRTRAALLGAVLRDGISDSLSGLARRTGLSQHAVAVEVKNLAGVGLVSLEAVGGADLVKGNREHPAAGLLVELLAVADAPSPGARDEDAPVRESLAYFGAPFRTTRKRRHLGLEATLARALAVARRDAAVLRSLPAVLLKHRRDLDWPALKEEARRLKVGLELRQVVELAADASGRTELYAHVADLRDGRRRTRAQLFDAAARANVLENIPGTAGSSRAAAKADATERERVRRMSVRDRALLALELGERLGALGGRRS